MALPDEDRGGTATTTNMIGTRDLIDKEQPTLVGLVSDANSIPLKAE